jgi:NADH dehydrogenase/NADH:ubiquinone oxidoreductase subunit G
VIRIVPRLNEEVNQEWISDKARFQYDALRYQRLNVPYLKGDKVRVAGGCRELLLMIVLLQQMLLEVLAGAVFVAVV